MTVTIIGVGLLGGSYALALREKYPKMRFVGVDASAVNGQLALAKGIVDDVLPLAEAVAQSTLVVLATPVNVILQQLPTVLDLLPPDATALDLGSTKEQICGLADVHPKRAQFVAAHPMAGTENSGPGAAFRVVARQKPDYLRP